MEIHDRFPKPIADLLQASKTAVKKKEYEASLSSANDALKAADKDNLTPSLVIGLLDYRHAIHVRMDNLEAALKDSKSMIRLDRKDARGYVRCGTVATLQGDNAAALKYFEHGLKNASASDPNLALLSIEAKKTRDRISADLVASRPRDPMTTLPIEIIEFILSYLDYRQHVQLLGVSRSWKKVLTAMPPLTDTLAFPRAAKPITPKLLLAALRRLKLPRDVKAKNLTQPAANILMDRLKSPHFRFVESLELDDQLDQLLYISPEVLGAWNLRKVTIGPRTAFQMPWVLKLLELCPLLEIGRFEKVCGFFDALTLSSKSLVELDITYAGNSIPPEIVLNLPRISKLRLARFGGLTTSLSTPLDFQQLKELEDLNLHYCGLSNILLPPQIKHLAMTACRFFNEGQDVSIVYPPLDNLETLNILDSRVVAADRAPWPQFIRQASIKTKPRTLTSLSLTQDPPARPGNRVQMLDIAWFLGVTSLRIEGPDIKDEHSPNVIRSCPRLETLYIKDAAITGVFVSDLIEVLGSQLRSFTLDNCAKVSRDVVTWAKERGVQVEYITVNESLGGRRIREQH
ncbi:hypothetical protein H2200_012461 [Cladophialophora chaetospira]|uniref:F-box domain-containing protein n=1 Tax=Cladophialophora chaetospira TaxID=386627 RepID=A0AA38WXY6_9EURO|nr:hypothetical protein H2200_012461 [Cladophialophora chaetospira]